MYDDQETEFIKKFYKDYNEKIDEILQKKDLISGTHKINPEKAKLWINSQLTTRRRDAARNLINNTHYVTFDELFQDIKNCVIQIYQDLDLKRDIYLFVMIDDKSSFYFFAIIALYFIKLLGYKEPMITYGLPENCQILVIDDASYTGGQISNIFQDSFFDKNENGIKNKNSQIFYGLSCISKPALTRLNYLKKEQEINLKIYPQKIFKSLKRLGKTEFLDLTFYFSPFLNGWTEISLYFDHKIADPVSTFMKTLNYGPILPKKLYYNYTELAHSFYFYGLIEEECDFLKYYNEMLLEEENIKQDINKLTCIPFIENFNLDTSFIPTITFDIFNKNRGFIETANQITKQEFTENEKEIIQKLNDINNRCPKSFYKNLFSN